MEQGGMNANGHRRVPQNELTRQEFIPTDQMASYVFDRMIQDLTTRLLPFLLSDTRFHVEIDHSGKPGDLVKLKITETVN